MSSYRESIFLYGEKQSGFGILTLPIENPPQCANSLPLLVIFNAGLLHREEPYRLNTMLARELATLGLVTLRVDLAGKGDSKTRDSRISNRESVAMDWVAIKLSLQQTFDVDQKYILMGLCSGADNAIKLACIDENVVGMVLLDTLCPRDKLFYLRRLGQKLFRFSALLQLPSYFSRRLANLIGAKNTTITDIPSLRDAPTNEELQQAMELMRQRSGSVLAIFTSYAYDYYNQVGQLAKVLDLPDNKICKEHLWLEMSHLYSLQAHRNKVVATIRHWVAESVL